METRTVTIGDCLKPRHSFYDKSEGRKLFSDFLTAIYIVRCKDTVLYIGATRITVRQRIKGHLTQRNSKLGQLIKKFRSSSETWTVEMHKMPDWETARKIEEQLIKELKPMLNEQHGA